MMSTATPPTHFGKNALRLGLFTPITLVVLMVLGFVISEVLKFNRVGAIVMLTAMACAPIAHCVGIVWGVMAFSKPNDNKRLGALGALLNAGLIGLGLVVAGDWFKYMGAFN